MKMKRWSVKALAVLSAAALLLSALGLSTGAKEEKRVIGETLRLDTSPYQEETFRGEMEQEKKGQLVLAENGKSDYVIVYPASAGKELKKAVRFLQNILTQMTGAAFAAQPAGDAVHKKEIVVGNTNRGGTPKAEETGPDGFRIHSEGERLFLCGAAELGSIYSVYTFLEDYLGCLWLSDSENYVPSLPTIKLAPMDSTRKPAMKWRNYYNFEVTQNDWFQRLRLNGIGYGADGKLNQYDQWGTWCHSYFSYVNPDQYFDSHPEYFAMKDGKRIRECDGLQAQLCLTNPDVLRIVKEEMGKRMKENPELVYWDFSVMDSWNVKGCECENCKGLDEAEGSGMGSLLPFINALAREFPDKMISTLAYFHTIAPPKTLKAEENVVIKLCSMPGSQASSYRKGETPNAKQFKELLENWKTVSSSLIVWDYVVDFQNLLLPFPNFAVQRENQKFYEENHVMGVFHQASREQGDEMADLRAYILSRLLWEGSSMDVNAAISKYVAAAYGKAAPKIAEYLQLCADHLHASGNDLGLYDNLEAHQDGYLSAEAIAQYQTIFKEALALVEGDEILTRRVREAEIPVLYAKMMEVSSDKTGRQEAAEEFFKRCGEFGITEIREVGCSVSEFQNGVYQSTLRYRAWLKVKVPVIIGGSVLGLLALAGAGLLIYKKAAKKSKKKTK